MDHFQVFFLFMALEPLDMNETIDEIIVNYYGRYLNIFPKEDLLLLKYDKRGVGES